MLNLIGENLAQQIANSKSRQICQNGRIRTQIGRHVPEIGRTRPGVVQIPQNWQNSHELDEVAPDVVEVAQCRPSLADFARKLGKTTPKSAVAKKWLRSGRVAADERSLSAQTLRRQVPAAILGSQNCSRRRPEARKCKSNPASAMEVGPCSVTRWKSPQSEAKGQPRRPTRYP